MNVKPVLSIIVPVYNVEKYLHKCVDSILSQTYQNYELILVDDGSSDNCGAICDDYSELDGRIKVIHKINGGVSSARNAGLDVAKGLFVSFVDSDDYISSDFYSGNIRLLLENKDIDMIRIPYSKVYEDHQEVFYNKYQIIKDKQKILEFIFDTKPFVWFNIYRMKAFIKTRFVDCELCEDVIISIDIAKCINALIVSNIGLYYYFQRSDSIVHSNLDYNFRENIMDSLERKIDFSIANINNSNLTISFFANYTFAVLNAIRNSNYSMIKPHCIKWREMKINFFTLMKSDISMKFKLINVFIRLFGFKAYLKFDMIKTINHKI